MKISRQNRTGLKVGAETDGPVERAVLAVREIICFRRTRAQRGRIQWESSQLTLDDATVLNVIAAMTFHRRGRKLMKYVVTGEISLGFWRLPEVVFEKTDSYDPPIFR